MAMTTGNVVGLAGFYVDVRFQEWETPALYASLATYIEAQHENPPTLKLLVIQKLNRSTVRTVALGETWGLRQGATVAITQDSIAVASGEVLVGRTVDPLGNSLDEQASVREGELQWHPVAGLLRQASPQMVSMGRSLNTLLSTGIRVIDTMVPIAEGMSVAVNGAPSTGKTTLMVQLVKRLFPKSFRYLVWASVGTSRDEVTSVRTELFRDPALQRCTTMFHADATTAPQVQALGILSAVVQVKTLIPLLGDNEKILLVIDDFGRCVRTVASEKHPLQAQRSSIFSAIEELIEPLRKHLVLMVCAVQTLPDDDNEQQTYDQLPRFDTTIALDHERASSGFYPAVDVLASRVEYSAMKLLSDTHREVHSTVRDVFATMKSIQDTLAVVGLENIAQELQSTVKKARKLNVWFANQPEDELEYSIARTIDELRQVLRANEDTT